MSSGLKPGDSVDDLCRACKLEREHTVIVTGDEMHPARVRCNICGSEHNLRVARLRAETQSLGSAVSTASGAGSAADADLPEEHRELAAVLRHVLREELGYTHVEMTGRFRGGELVVKPGTPGAQEKSVPLDTFFAKIVRIRNQLRVLEQQINASGELSDESKLKLQTYVTACYGSMTSFNYLFKDDEDRFVGQKGA